MKEPAWVLPEVVLAVHRMLLAEHGGLPGIREKALLHSALARLRHRFVYEECISIFQLASAYAFGLAKDHPFVDGNKRIALATAAVFLELNGYTLDAPEPDAVLIFQQLAAGVLSGEALAGWFEETSYLLG